MRTVVLAPGRDRSVRRRHPWLMSGAVAHLDGGDPEIGAWVRVVSAEGECLGWGHLSPASQIRVRMLWFGKEEPDDGLIAERIASAVKDREGSPLVGATDAVRLVNAEGDGLPGLVADRYGEMVVVRLSSAGMVTRRELVARALREATRAPAGFERADAASARREGVQGADRSLWGEPPAPRIAIREAARRYDVDVLHGQKTGFYLDQRDSRALVEQCAAGRRMLDLFGYTGGFAVAAAVGGAASATVVESSREASELARTNLARNAPAVRAEVVTEDAFRWVRSRGEKFDLLVIDPPPLARRRADLARAARAYKDVVLFALRRASPGALVLAFACSSQVRPDLFRKICFGASLDAGRPAQVLRTLGLPADHPVGLDHPEGDYLTGLLLQV